MGEDIWKDLKDAITGKKSKTKIIEIIKPNKIIKS